jgi:hypothetical protein
MRLLGAHYHHLKSTCSPSICHSPLLKEYRALKRKWQLLGEPIESVGAVYALLRALTMCHEKINIVKDVVDSIPRTEGVLVYTHYLESAHILAAR